MRDGLMYNVRSVYTITLKVDKYINEIKINLVIPRPTLLQTQHTHSNLRHESKPAV